MRRVNPLARIIYYSMQIVLVLFVIHCLFFSPSSLDVDQLALRAEHQGEPFDTSDSREGGAVSRRRGPAVKSDPADPAARHAVKGEEQPSVHGGQEGAVREEGGKGRHALDQRGDRTAGSKKELTKTNIREPKVKKQGQKGSMNHGEGAEHSQAAYVLPGVKVHIKSTPSPSYSAGYKFPKEYNVYTWIPPQVVKGKKGRVTRAWINISPWRRELMNKEAVYREFGHVVESLRYFGYHVMLSDTEPDQTWDVLWGRFVVHENGIPYSHVNPGSFLYQVPKTQSFHHRDLLITKTQTDNIKPGFLLPVNMAAFKEYTMKNNIPKEALWVVQGTNGKEYALLNMDQIEVLTKDRPIVANQFLSNPFLIDNRKLTLGVYIAVTSAFPLSVYMYKPHWVVQLCRREFQPMDINNADKFFTYDTVESFRLFETSVKKLTNVKGNLNHQELLKIYLKKMGKNWNKFQNDIEKAIYDILVSKKEEIGGYWFYDRGMSMHNFYELFRVNIEIDEDLKPWIFDMERRPLIGYGDILPSYMNWTSTLLKDLMTFTGIGSVVEDEHVSLFKDLVPEYVLNVKSSFCEAEECFTKKACQKQWQCSPCKHCLSYNDKKILKKIALENMRKGQSWVRLVPRSFKDQAEAKRWFPKLEKNFVEYFDIDKMLFPWFNQKCVQSSRWCR